MDSSPDTADSSIGGIRMEEKDRILEILLEKVIELPKDRRAALFQFLEEEERKDLTPDDLSKMFNVDRQTIHRKIKEGKIKAYKETRFWRIKREDVPESL